MAVLAGGGAGYALLGSDDASAIQTPRVAASIDTWRWAPQNELPSATADDRDDAGAADDAATERPAIEASAARPSQAAQEDDEPEASVPAAKDPKPTKAATKQQSQRSDPKPEHLDDLAPGVGASSSEGDDVLVKAEVLKNGVALPPLEAPPEVRAIFEAGNTIARSPYKWGGGHGKWQDNGYDCSGSVSYALAAAGLINAPQASGPLMKYGKPGKGKWITIYTNPGHVFMVVAGVRFDTVARGQTGSRWINSMTSTAGYVARHPAGF